MKFKKFLATMAATLRNVVPSLLKNVKRTEEPKSKPPRNHHNRSQYRPHQGDQEKRRRRVTRSGTAFQTGVFHKGVQA